MVYSDKADKGTIVYVGGLLETIKKEAIEAEFEKFGKLTRVWVAFNPPGFAFVEFDRKEDAETAVNAMHNANILGSKLRVEISRGRPRGRGGMSRGGSMSRGGGRGMDRGGFRGGRGDFRGGRGDFRGGRGDFGRGRGLPRGRGGFGGRPFDREPFGDRFDDFERRKPEFPERDFGPPRDFGARRELGGGRDYDDIGARRGFGGGMDDPARDYNPRDIGGRDYPPRGIGGRDYPPRDMERDYPPRDIGGRDFPSRDGGGRGYPPRDVSERDYIGGRDARDYGGRDYGVEREMNGVRSYGGPRDIPSVDAPPRAYPASRDLGVSQATLGARDYPPRDIPTSHDVEAARDYAARGAAPPRDYGGTRDIGLRRDAVRDFEEGAPRDFGARPARPDYPAGDRFGGGRGVYGNGDMRRPGAAPGGRFAGREVGGSDDYGGYGARDRFRSRSPIGRGGSRPPMY